MDKNDKFLIPSLNFEEPPQGVYGSRIYHPLIAILRLKDENRINKWMKYYFELCAKYKVVIKKEIQTDAIDRCNKKEHLSKYKDTIETHFNEMKNVT